MPVSRRTLLLLIGIVLLVPAVAHAQQLEAPTPASVAAECPVGVEPERDLDGDCVDDTLEEEGYDRNLETCVPGPDAPGCFVTDPTSWSSDGDPYSDFQEATNVNMDNNVEAPYNSPLVAAAPQIEVSMLRYRFTPRTNITDARGREVTTESTQEFSVSTTAGVSVTTGAEVSTGLTGPEVSASVETEVSFSVTAGYSSSQTQGESLNWETATSTQSDEAATLALDIVARNVGSATALDVRPTFNLFLGEEPLGTITPSDPFPYNLVPGGEPSENDFITVDRRRVGNSDAPIMLSIGQLRRLQTGTPLRITVIGMEARISRWRPEDSNWSCPEPCQWEEFQDQIQARTLRLLVDFGYSGDPDAEIPRQFVGNPFEYRVYTGSPSARPGFTLRDVVSFVGFDLEPQGEETLIEGRPYPSRWYMTSGPEASGRNRDSTFVDYWAAAGEPDDLLGMVMPRGVSLLMASPDPVDPGPVIHGVQLLPSMRGLVVAAGPKGSIPAQSGEAHVFLNGRREVIPLERNADGYWATPDSLVLPIGVGSSYVVLRDVDGSQRLIGPGLTPSVPVTTDRSNPCAGIASAYYLEPRFDEGEAGTRDGVVTVFLDGDLDRPGTAFCINEGAITDVWYPQTNDMGSADVEGVVVLDRERRIAVGENTILTSRDGGQSWRHVALAEADRSRFHAVAFREGTGTGVAVGDGGVFMRTTDYGETWTRTSVTGTGDYYDVDYAGGATWYAVGQNRVRRSTDDGLTWIPAAVEVVDEEGNSVTRPNFVNLSTVEFVTETRGAIGDPLMADENGRIYVTEDGGITWRQTVDFDGHSDFTYTGEGWVIVGRTAIVFSPDLFVRGNAYLVHSLAAGRTFQAVSFATPEIGYAVEQGGPVWRTEDGGQTWASPYGGFPTPTYPGTNYMTDIHMLDANIGAVAGTDGVIGATDSGGGVPTYAIGTSVEPEGDPAAARPGTGVELAANYPNPFRGRTTIGYRLEHSQDVRLDVFDLLGRRVATLVEGRQPPGAHDVSFNADALASGVYVYRLHTEGATIVRRMLVLR